MSRLITAAIFLVLILAPTSLLATTFSSATWYQDHQAAADSCIVEFVADADFTNTHHTLLAAGYTLRQVSVSFGYAIFAAELPELKGWRGRDLTIGVVNLNPSRDLEAQLHEIIAVPGIETVSPNYIHHPSWVPNDPYYGNHQGNFRQIYMEDAWNLTKGQGATVAVIDTGYRQGGLSDRAENLLTGYDFWGNDSNVQDYIGHGTHVANTVAERTNNGVGCAGIAFKASIMPCKVFPDYDQGALESDIIDAIYWATTQGADVINMSLGGGGYVSATNAAINNAVDNDVIVFAASGNDGAGSVDYPGAYQNCIAVGATKRHSVGANPARASFSNYGSALDLAAPGTEILQETYDSYYGGVDYYQYDGTSSASPHAAAVAALLVSYNGADALAIRNAMESTAHTSTGNWTNTLGWGEIDAYDALVAYGGMVSNDKPEADASATPKSGYAPLTVQFDASGSDDPDGEIAGYYWWIDATGQVVGKKKKVTFTFDEPGTFQVKLRVTDDDGATDTDTVTIKVLASSGDDDDSDDDDSDLGDDPCGEMLEVVYYECDLNLIYNNGQSMKAATAYQMCLDEGSAQVWECLLECFNHDQVESCSDWRSCATQNCGVKIKADGGNNSDDSASGGCGE